MKTISKPTLILCFLLMTGFVQAKIDTVRVKRTSIVLSDVFSVQGKGYTSNSFDVANAKGRVILKANTNNPTFYTQYSYARVYLEVKSWNEGGTLISTTNIQLEVGYDPTGVTLYKDQAVYMASNAYKMSITVTGLASSLPGNAMPDNLELSAEEIIEYYYPFTTSNSVDILAHQIASNEILLKWSPDIPAEPEEYDLEWTFVNDYNGTGGYLASSSLRYDFKHNSTRITTTDTFYRLPLLYEHGYFLYRVRPVGRGGAGHRSRLEGNWTIAANAGTLPAGAIHLTAPHEENFNWQYNINYTEKGLRRDQIDYYDGSLRNRQSLVKFNTQKEAVVSEKIYDWNGRPAIQTLPAPTGTGALDYRETFHQDNQGNPYSSNDFDPDDGSDCHAEPAPLAEGASDYYTDQASTTRLIDNYIPESDGFPFIQQEYTPDNTGRIRRNGAPGDSLRIGSGHEQIYYYGTPQQVELDRLFGTEAGLHKHYKKNMVRDANGQFSISYLDQYGRVIATSMAGDGAANLDALPSNTGASDITSDLLQHNNDLRQNEQAIVSQSTILVSTQDIYDFVYSMSREFYNDACLAVQCVNCAYDLQIRIQNDCGEDLLNPPVTRLIEAPGPTCDLTLTPPHFQFDTTVFLTEGNYLVTKWLSVHPQMVDSLVKLYKDTSSCLKTQQDFIQEAIDSTDFSGCNYSCEKCKEEAQAYLDAGGSQAGFDSLMNDCAAICDDIPDQCQGAYEIMLADMSPGGQYALYTPSQSGAGVTFPDPLSILKTGNNLPGSPTWQDAPVYFDEHGNPDSVMLGDGINYHPKDLPVEKFIKHFKRSWAQSLVEYHPEYCYYQWCVMNKASKDFDYLLMTTESFDEASGLTLLNPRCLSTTTNLKGNYVPAVADCDTTKQDPFFKAGGLGVAYAATMDSFIMNYGMIPGTDTPRTMWQAAAVVAKCGYHMASTGDTSCADYYYEFADGICSKDKQWELFKGFYLGVKIKLEEQAREAFATNNHCSNRCIGAGSCHRYADLVSFITGLAIDTSASDSCYGIASFFYVGKKRRFPASADMEGSSTASTLPEDQPFQEHYDDNATGSQTVDTCACEKLLSNAAAATAMSCTDESELLYNSYSVYISNSTISTLKGVCSTAYAKCGQGGWTPGAAWCDTAANYLKTLSNTVPSLLTCTEGEVLLTFDTGACRRNLIRIATMKGKTAYATYIDSVEQAVRARYISACLQASHSEELLATYAENEYHYTLYYYDQAGNLVKTVPPKGVVPITAAATLDQVDEERMNGSSLTDDSFTQHTLATTYLYNSRNQVILQQTPDGGDTRFWYDQMGRLILSQNAKQTPNKYSYTTYDGIGRIISVGEFTPLALLPLTEQHTTNPYMLAAWMDAGTKSQITSTYYDMPMNPAISAAFGSDGQQNLIGRVATVTYQDVFQTSSNVYDYATHYSYDIHGNVSTLLQEIPILNSVRPVFKRIDYEYDLVSGNVKQVSYQKGSPDQFYHRYLYDADNRIVQVSTSLDGVIWDNDARYSHYRHGPLARIELGEAQVQGLDYAYTLPGWLKGVNSSALVTKLDMGKDGYTTDRLFIGEDVFGFTLGYFNGDYEQSALYPNFEAAKTGSTYRSGISDLYNGNISDMVISYVTPAGSTMRMGRAFDYDQLNRLTKASAFQNLDTAANAWKTTSEPADGYYQEQFAYDPNGNITGLIRRAESTTVQMDNLDYSYTAGTNRLASVAETAPVSAYADDLEGTQNYTYDAIGNLESDLQQGIANIGWNVYGKIKTITRSDGKSLEFKYDGNGNRILKILKDPNIANWSYVSYVRDAQGNILAIYSGKLTNIESSVSFTRPEVSVEYPLYGSSRIGMTQRMISEQGAIAGIQDPGLTGDTLLTDLNNYETALASSVTLSNTTMPAQLDAMEELTLMHSASLSVIGTINTLKNSLILAVQAAKQTIIQAAAPVLGVIVPILEQTPVLDAINQVNTILSQMHNTIRDFIIIPRPDPSQYYTRLTGVKQYELANHLGNVQTVISDQKIFSAGTLTHDTFTSGFDDWTANSPSDTLSLVGGRLKVSSITSGEGAKRFYTTVPGQKYTFSVEVENVNTADVVSMLMIEHNGPLGPAVISAKLTVEGLNTVTFIAPTNLTRAKLMKVGGTGTVTRFYLDNARFRATDYEAEVTSAQDYYAFGSVMPGRSYNTPDYRFGFNGMEKDDEVKGSSNHYTTEFRQYDPRLGRWFSIDPEREKFPSWTPYNFVFNNPNIYADQFGNIPWWKLIAGYNNSSQLKAPSASRVHPKLGSTRPHHGLDMKGKQGTPIHAAASGKVIAARWHEGYGWTVVIDHGKGHLTLYAHMHSKDAMKVEVGDKVENNQIIGEVGQTGGVSTGDHLHVEYIYNSDGSTTYIAPKNKKNSMIYSPMDIDDLQNIIDGKEQKQITLLDGTTVTLGSTENKNETSGLNYPSGQTYLNQGKDQSLFDKIRDFFTGKEFYDDDYFETMDRYEKSKKQE